MSYLTPTIAPSGITFAALQGAGLAGHKAALVAANAFPADAKKYLAAASASRLQQAYSAYAEAVSGFLRGDPVPAPELNARLLAFITAMKAELAVAEEIAVLVAANPGTIRQVADGSAAGYRLARTFP